jgi:murein DD-endopeptidase MepM/ murein hydrolase activator NlpD
MMFKIVVLQTPYSLSDLIGYVGSTALSTGPHVHYEVRRIGSARNTLDEPSKR